MKTLQTSCSTFITENMKVITESERIRKSREAALELLLGSGRHDCLTCEQNGECELQSASYYHGIDRDTIEYSEKYREIDKTSEFITIDRNKCILCGRCVEACNKTVVNQVLSFGYRGYDTEVIVDIDMNMGESSCVQCGECSQICPTGAIIDTYAIGKAQSWELEKVETVCPYCGVGCKVELHIDRKKNKIVKVKGVEGAPANDGMLCVKGRYGFDFVGHEERLTTPLIKENGKFREASWDEAISLVATKLLGIKEKYGADSIMALASAKVTNEENYTFQKMIRSGLKTNNIDHCARL
jgi:predicted molibdopterin-dependent oxidoreductase YjgC